ncbi:MAG: hypothetical protein GF393_11790 [Armatimonadia bacterium]|nr:hypothetical protein [Armatimonadia bacterium]
MARGKAQSVVLAGLAGGAAANVAMFLTFRLLGMGLDGGGILLDPAVQSEKLIAVWTQIEPLPRIVTQPVLMGLGVLAFGVLHAYIYLGISADWPKGLTPRALRFGGVLFAMVYLFWEFFTPFNMFGEPVWLVALELAFWAVVAFAEAFALVAVVEGRTGMARPTTNGRDARAT